MTEERMPHRLVLEERGKLTVTGVTEISGFDDTAVIAQTELGQLLVQGQELKLKKLSAEDGQVAVEGRICALSYEEPRQSRGRWRRILG